MMEVSADELRAEIEAGRLGVEVGHHRRPGWHAREDGAAVVFRGAQEHVHQRSAEF